MGPEGLSEWPAAMGMSGEPAAMGNVRSSQQQWGCQEWPAVMGMMIVFNELTAQKGES